MASVLVVEDESIVALDLSRRLAEMGHSVAAVVSSGEEAVSRAADLAPDVILMDVKLRGDIDGIEAARRIGETSSVPIVYLTSFAEESTLERAKATDPYAYLVKPFGDHELWATIELTLHSHSSGRRLREVLHGVRDAVIATDDAGAILMMNTAAAAMTGTAAGQVTGRPVTEVVHLEAAGSEGRNALDELLGEERQLPPGTDVSVVAGDGTRTPVECHCFPLLPGGRGGHVLSLRDVSAYRAREQELRRTALHDPLTGIPNRKLFEEHLAHSFRQLRRREDYLFGVAFVDLDGFKNVNDSFGHAVGDQVIVETTRRLTAMLRPSDVVARVGGDEFVVLLENLKDRGDAAVVGERMARAFGEPFPCGDGRSARISASVGIALSAVGHTTAAEILRAADAAMYRVKMAGKAGYEVC